MIVNVRHTGIVVTDLANCEAFYAKLGFETVSRDTEQGEFIEQVTGYDGVCLSWVKMAAKDGYLLELLQYMSHPESPAKSAYPANRLGCSHMAFTVESAQEMCDKIVSLGGKMINPPAPSPNGKVKVAYCHDPEGVLMEIVEELDS